MTTYGVEGVGVAGIGVSVGISVETGTTRAGAVSVGRTAAVCVGLGLPKSWLAAKIPTTAKQSTPIINTPIIARLDLDLGFAAGGGATGDE